MLTRTLTILSAAVFLGTASAALAMSPTGHSYKPFANAYARAMPGNEAAQSYAPTTEELADHQSFFYRH